VLSPVIVIASVYRLGVVTQQGYISHVQFHILLMLLQNDGNYSFVLRDICVSLVQCIYAVDTHTHAHIVRSILFLLLLLMHMVFQPI
jgi:hypothetical protein